MAARQLRPMSPRFAWLSLIAPAVLLHSPAAFAADLVFSGSLDRLSHGSISLRLADRRVIDARLPDTSLLSAARIGAEYSMGDQVQITCKPIQPVWEDDTSRYQFLELTKLRFLRRASAEELTQVALRSPTGREGPNLLRLPNAASPLPLKARTDAPAPSAGLDAAAHDKLELAREVNLDYVANMPNFVADETAKRYTSSRGSTQWRYLDTIETEITFKGSLAARDQIRRNGKPWDRPFQALPGFKWYGGFGTEIRPVFDPLCPTSIDYQGRAEVRGKQLLKYAFSSPPDGCFGPFTSDYERYNPTRTGHVFLDDSAGGNAGHVIQYDEDATGFPAGFGFAQREEEVSWDDVKIGDAWHLLPVGANFLIVYAAGDQGRIVVTYKNHRHFEAATNVVFH
jgi:hypothetical protein